MTRPGCCRVAGGGPIRSVLPCGDNLPVRDYLHFKRSTLSFRWSNGQRKFLKLNIDQYYTSWNISISFDREVSFEVITWFFRKSSTDISICQAWKGDVVKLSNTSYTLTNKCFNNILYPCQCLELGFLIRY